MEVESSGPPVGRLNGVWAEPGTVLGPDTSGRWFAVVEQDPAGVRVRYASRADLDAVHGPPRSMTEREIIARGHRGGE